MTGENNNEKRLKQCLDLFINTVTDAINNSDEDFHDQFKKLQDDNLPCLSFQCRNYLLDVLYDYEGKTWDKERLEHFLHDLNGRLCLLNASQAAWDGKQPLVETFLNDYPELKDKSGLYGTTLLYSTARNNHFHLVKYLVEKAKCYVNAKNEEYLEKGQAFASPKATIGSTALHAACFNGHLHIVKYLIQHGGDYFLLNSVQESPVENGQTKGQIQTFFTDFLLFDYLSNSVILPTKTILREIDETKQSIMDCIWEYKLFSNDQWLIFTTDLPTTLQRYLLNDKFQADIQLKTSRDGFSISIAQFLRSGKPNDYTGNSAWIRCRGSSLRNFHCYSQWQMMFMEHPKGVTNSSSPLEIFKMSVTTKITLNSWYTFHDKMNFLLETAMNYRRRYVNIHLDFIDNAEILIDLEHFTFTNQQNTIKGFLRWIPKIISNNDDNLTVLNNFQLPTKTEFLLLTTKRVKQAEDDGKIAGNDINMYSLKYEDAFGNDKLTLPNKQPINDTNPSKSIRVIQDDLLSALSDIIVICTSSKYLFENVCRVGGKALQKTFDRKVKENKNDPVISVPTQGKLKSKAVYFVRWQPNSDQNILCQSIKKIVADVIERAVDENYHSIAFPAIGCGEYGCSITVIAEAFIKEVQRQLIQHPLAVLFVIQPDKKNIYDEFQNQLGTCKQQENISITVDKGTIEVEKGNITNQKVDVIIGSSSSENLRQILISAGGIEVEKAYERECDNNPNSLIISTPPGQLPCKRVFFLKWEPDPNPDTLRQSVIDLIWNLIQNVASHNFTSIAFPALGCGEHACSVDIVVKTMVREMKQQIKNRKLPWIVKFIIQPNQQNIFDEFCRQLLSLDDNAHRTSDNQLPSNWEKTVDHKLKVLVPKDTNEYQSIITEFNKEMKKNCKQIIKIERIQNERWYMQYLAHSSDFQKRLNANTEKLLYHGCPELAANSIVEDCFNRSFAGVNGVAFGVGVYFSSDAVYSHGYTRPNSKGERCMFIARVLVGKTTLGNPSMKTRPVGFDSTTDGNHMFITYHDAQAYAEYLITYK